MFFAGSGNEKIDVDKGSELAIAHFTYSGDENFIVWGLGPDGQQNSLLVNTIGECDGIVPLDFLVGEHTTRFEVESSGSWTVEILPLIEANSVTAPGDYQGTGDDIVSISGCEPAGATFYKESVGEIVVISYGESRELLVEQLMPFEGIDVALPPETLFLEVKSEDPWIVSLSC
jgi:hypothetical protein